MRTMRNLFRQFYNRFLCRHRWSFVRRFSDDIVMQRCYNCEMTRSISIVTALRCFEGDNAQG
jgi:hypothetical protein